MRNVRPGPELAVRADSNLPGCAFAQVSSYACVVGGVVAVIGVYLVSELTRTLLGWEPMYQGLVADLKEGHYFRTQPAEIVVSP